MSNYTETSATRTLKHARWMRDDMASKFADVPPLSCFYKLARAAQVAMEQTDEELRQKARDERVLRGMVAGYIQDQRAVGRWDGE